MLFSLPLFGTFYNRFYLLDEDSVGVGQLLRAVVVGTEQDGFTMVKIVKLNEIFCRFKAGGICGIGIYFLCREVPETNLSSLTVQVKEITFGKVKVRFYQ